MEINSFTFPTTTTQPCQTDSSPPLWHVISPSTNPRLSASQSRQPPEDTTSLCDMADHQHHARLNEDKMDMLWEDFNEELRFERDPPSPNSHPSLDFSKEMVHFGCTSLKRPTRKPSNHSGAVSFFKNLFLNHNSHHQSRSKRRSRH